MNYKGFKEQLESSLYADVKVPDDDKILIPMIMSEIRKIAYRCEPLALIVKTPDFKIIRSLGGGDYLRESAIIRNDESKIDLDKELIDALVFSVSARLSKKNKADLESDATGVIADFNFKILEAKENDE